MYKIILKFALVSMFFGFTQIIHAQQLDSLFLQEVIQKVLINYPSLKQAEIAVAMSDARILMIKGSHLPDVDLTGSYSRIGPVPKIDFPGMGQFSLAPENNFNTAINIRENIYDFGKTDKDVKVENQIKQISEMTVDQVKQRLTYAVIGVFYNLQFLQQALAIKDDQLKNLNSHLNYVQQKKNTGSGIQLDILSTKVKLSNIENQKTDIQTAISGLMANLNVMIGQKISQPLFVKGKSVQIVPLFSLDSILNIAYSNREEVKIAMEKVKLGQLKIESIKAQTNPILTAFASGGFKNGYVPELNKLKANYAAGLGLRVPIYDANRKKYNIMLAQSTIESSQYEIEMVKRTIANEIIELQTQLLASMTKINQSEKQVELAASALQMAEVNFKEGVITNLEVLDAETNLSESKLSLLKSEIDYSLNLMKLKIAMGEKLY